MTFSWLEEDYAAIDAQSYAPAYEPYTPEQPFVLDPLIDAPMYGPPGPDGTIGGMGEEASYATALSPDLGMDWGQTAEAPPLYESPAWTPPDGTEPYTFNPDQFATATPGIDPTSLFGNDQNPLYQPPAPELDQTGGIDAFIAEAEQRAVAAIESGVPYEQAVAQYENETRGYTGGYVPASQERLDERAMVEEQNLRDEFVQGGGTLRDWAVGMGMDTSAELPFAKKIQGDIGGYAEAVGSQIPIAPLRNTVTGETPTFGPLARGVAESFVPTTYDQMAAAALLSFTPGLSDIQGLARFADTGLSKGIGAALRGVVGGADDLIRPSALPNLPGAVRIPRIAEVPALSREAGRLTEAGQDLRTLVPGTEIAGGAPSTLPGANTLEQVFGWTPPTAHLTTQDRVLNLLKETVGVGVKADESVTPMLRERADALQVIEQQSNRVGSVVSKVIDSAFDLDPSGRVLTLPDAPTISHIAARLPEYQPLLSVEQRSAMQVLREVMEPFVRALTEQGLNPNTRPDIIPGGFYIPRGRALEEGADLPLPQGRGSAGANKGFQKSATFNTQMEGIDAGFRYSKVAAAIESFARDAGTRALDEYVGAELKLLGTPIGAKPTRGMGTISEGFQNQLRQTEFPDALRAAIEKELKVGRNLGTVEPVIAAVNGLLRGMRSTADISFTGIQGLLGLGSDPRAYRQAWVTAIKSFVDKNAVGEYILKFDQEAQKAGSPTSQDWISRGVRFGGIDTEFTIGSRLGRIDPLLRQAPVIQQSNRAFGGFGDVLRLTMAQHEYEIRQIVGGSKAASESMSDIAASMNRATGWSKGRFLGDFGSIVQFAPRFFMSQLETVAKAATDGTIQGDIARKQIVKTMGAGTLLTVAANEALGNREKGFNYWQPFINGNPNPNFMRIRVGGQDISVFGPWDSLVKATMFASKGDFGYLARSKASPVVAMAWDLITGSNFLGEPVTTESFLRGMLPFSLQTLGNEPIEKTLIGMTGAKTNTVTPSEQVASGRYVALNDAAKLEAVFSPEMAKAALGQDYRDLGPAARRALNESLSDDDKKALEGLKAQYAAEDSAAVKAGERRSEASLKFDELMNTLKTGAGDPFFDVSKVKDEFKRLSNDRDSRIAELYTGLERPDTAINKVLDFWYAIPEKSKVGGVVDWDRVYEKESNLLVALKEQDPPLATMLAYEIKNAGGGTEKHQIERLYDSTGKIWDSYYQNEPKFRDDWLKVNPKEDALLWFLGYFDNVKSQEAARIADGLTENRRIVVK